MCGRSVAIGVSLIQNTPTMTGASAAAANNAICMRQAGNRNKVPATALSRVFSSTISRPGTSR